MMAYNYICFWVVVTLSQVLNAQSYIDLDFERNLIPIVLKEPQFCDFLLSNFKFYGNPNTASINNLPLYAKKIGCESPAGIIGPVTGPYSLCATWSKNGRDVPVYVKINTRVRAYDKANIEILSKNKINNAIKFDESIHSIEISNLIGDPKKNSQIKFSNNILQEIEKRSSVNAAKVLDGSSNTEVKLDKILAQGSPAMADFVSSLFKFTSVPTGSVISYSFNHPDEACLKTATIVTGPYFIKATWNKMNRNIPVIIKLNSIIYGLDANKRILWTYSSDEISSKIHNAPRGASTIEEAVSSLTILESHEK